MTCSLPEPKHGNRHTTLPILRPFGTESCTNLNRIIISVSPITLSLILPIKYISPVTQCTSSRQLNHILNKKIKKLKIKNTYVALSNSLLYARQVEKQPASSLVRALSQSLIRFFRSVHSSVSLRKKRGIPSFLFSLHITPS